MRHEITTFLTFLLSAAVISSVDAQPRTSLDRASAKYTVAKKPYVVLKRGDVEAVIVNNEAVDDEVLPGHRAGYSGVASLNHTKQPRNIFVPNYAGLNYEHIHDGTIQDRDVLFEPRRAPMQVRVINQHTVDLYQAPSPHWGLESCLRYEMLDDGVIEMTLECIPRRKTFSNDYIALFWASYMHQPESLDIHFKGYDTGASKTPRWIRGITPSHGTLSTHVGADDQRVFEHDDKFPLTLAFNRSKHRFVEPWYYGVSHGMALVYMFRPQDQMRLTQSPSGGGKGNPAWDFQCFFPNYKIGERYQIVMRAMYIPYESPEQIETATKSHRAELVKQ